jgi:membrane-bound lytic murein transglycosylase B
MANCLEIGAVSRNLELMNFLLGRISAALVLGLVLPAMGFASTCGNDASGFAAWKQQFAQEAARAGVRNRGLQALAQAQYASATIAADRNQKSFRYSLQKFMQVRGADTIVAQGRSRKARNPNFYASLERVYGVPSGILLAIHGMETGFGGFMGDSSVVSAIVTLTYDCRRSEFFKPHAIGALMLVDRGTITVSTRGAKHGELGHTQFLPGNALRYGVDGNGDGRIDFYNLTDAMASTANFLRQKGWRPGAGYQPGQPNYAVIQQWNAASVYQQAIAIMAARIDQ